MLILFLRFVRRDEHLAEVLELRWTTDFFREQGELHYMEKLVVEFVRLVEVLLLHGMSHTAVFAVRVFSFVRSNATHKKRHKTHPSWGTGAG